MSLESRNWQTQQILLRSSWTCSAVDSEIPPQDQFLPWGLITIDLRDTIGCKIVCSSCLEHVLNKALCPPSSTIQWMMSCVQLFQRNGVLIKLPSTNAMGSCAFHCGVSFALSAFQWPRRCMTCFSLTTVLWRTSSSTSSMGFLLDMRRIVRGRQAP